MAWRPSSTSQTCRATWGCCSSSSEGRWRLWQILRFRRRRRPRRASMPTPEHQRWSEDRVARELGAWSRSAALSAGPTARFWQTDADACTSRRCATAVLSTGRRSSASRSSPVIPVRNTARPRSATACGCCFASILPGPFQQSTGCASTAPRGLAEQIKHTGAAPSSASCGGVLAWRRPELAVEMGLRALVAHDRHSVSIVCASAMSRSLIPPSECVERVRRTCL